MSATAAVPAFGDVNSFGRINPVAALIALNLALSQALGCVMRSTRQNRRYLAQIPDKRVDIVSVQG